MLPDQKLIQEREKTKEWKLYNDIYRDVFHTLGFQEQQRELCQKLTQDCIKKIKKYKATATAILNKSLKYAT